MVGVSFEDLKKIICLKIKNASRNNPEEHSWDFAK